METWQSDRDTFRGRKMKLRLTHDPRNSSLRGVLFFMVLFYGTISIVLTACPAENSNPNLPEINYPIKP